MSAPFATAESIFAEFFGAGNAPGGIWALCERGEVVRSVPFGVREIGAGKSGKGDPGISVDEETRFRIASMTKSFAAAATLFLRDRGMIDLDRPVSKLLTSTTPSQTLGNLTCRKLLTMTADLPTDDPWADRQLGATDGEFTTFFATDVGSAGCSERMYTYSNLAYMLLGRVLTECSGTPVMDLITKNLLAPLELSGTVWNRPEDASLPWASGYTKRAGGWVAVPAVRCLGDGAAFGGLASTVRDLARWMEFLRCGEGEPGAWESILSRRSRLEMQHGYAVMPGTVVPLVGIVHPERQHSRYGFGLRNFRLGAETFIGHSGGLPGYGSHFRWNPGSGLGIVALTNGTYAPVWNPCTTALEYVVRSRPSSGFRRGSGDPMEHGTDRSTARLTERLTDRLTERGQVLVAAAEHLCAQTGTHLAEKKQIFTEQFFLDYPEEALCADLRMHWTLLGTGERGVVTNPLRGQSAVTEVSTATGTVNLEFLLEPLSAARIQSLKISSSDLVGRVLREAFLGIFTEVGMLRGGSADRARFASGAVDAIVRLTCATGPVRSVQVRGEGRPNRYCASVRGLFADAEIEVGCVPSLSEGTVSGIEILRVL